VIRQGYQITPEVLLAAYSVESQVVVAHREVVPQNDNRRVCIRLDSQNSCRLGRCMSDARAVLSF